MKRLIEFLLSLICTFIFMLGILFQFLYLFLKYSFIGIGKAYNESLKKAYNSLDKGWE